jgi:hypothetical protein
MNDDRSVNFLTAKPSLLCQFVRLIGFETPEAQAVQGV